VRVGLFLAALLIAGPVQAGDVSAAAPHALSVTVYRAPYRNGGSLDLNSLGGFALITETRLVHLPAGESRLRFEGVVDGIQSESAIVTGLPDGVIEKNRDAAVLSPSALVRAALGADVTLVRTNRKTGKVTRVPAKIHSADDHGVVFETAEGVEALRCAGVPETFSYSRVPAGLSSVPTLSVLTRTAREVTATVTLSYLAQGFDWAADYTATLAPDGKTLNLGAWITLANGNGVSLPNAQTQIVAGRLNREYAAQFSNPQPQVVARCWPMGRTSDGSEPGVIGMVSPLGKTDRFRNEDIMVTARKAMPMLAMAVAAPAPPPPPPPPEQLGDLKLYRVPQTTTIAARQSKQTRLLEQHGVPFQRIYGYDVPAVGDSAGPATALLRTRNDKASQLGLPLPAGRVSIFSSASARAGFVGETNLRDLAEDEEVELKLAPVADVQVRQIQYRYEAKPVEFTALTPELILAHHSGTRLEQVEISSARPLPLSFELRLQTEGAQKIIHADQPIGKKDGRPIFRLTIPANGSIIVHYVVE
jgi:hypothetical protein